MSTVTESPNACILSIKEKLSLTLSVVYLALTAVTLNMLHTYPLLLIEGKRRTDRRRSNSFFWMLGCRLLHFLNDNIPSETRILQGLDRSLHTPTTSTIPECITAITLVAVMLSCHD